MPPTRNDGSSPARSSRNASRLVVVVLPWVPATTSGFLPRRNSSAVNAGMLVKGRRASSTASTSGLPRESALPITTSSASSGMFDAAYGERSSMPSPWSWLDIGGYTSWSEPVTTWPRAFSRPASDAIAVPQTAERWTFTAASADRRLQHAEIRALARALEARAHAERERHVGVPGVAGREPERDRDVQAVERLEHDVLERIARVERGRAAGQVPEHDPADA